LILLPFGLVLFPLLFTFYPYPLSSATFLGVQKKVAEEREWKEQREIRKRKRSNDYIVLNHKISTFFGCRFLTQEAPESIRSIFMAAYPRGK